MRSWVVIAVLAIGAANDVAADLRLTRVGEFVFVRGGFDDSRDIIQLVSLNPGAVGTNNPLNLTGIKTVPRGGDVNDAVAFAKGDLLSPQGDDIAPIRYNDTYVGANHGPAIVQEVTFPNHGKTDADVGSDWVEQGKVRFTLVKVVDKDKLWFVSENKRQLPEWRFHLNMTGRQLEHLHGAQNTDPVAITSVRLVQLLPALQNQHKSVLLDGVKSLEEDGVYTVKFVDFVHSYTIPNPAEVIDFVRANVGNEKAVSFVDPSIGADIKRTVRYRFSDNVSMTVYDEVEALNKVELGYIGSVQAAAPAIIDKELWQYVPGSSPIQGSLKTWDFSRGENISGPFELIKVAEKSWADPNRPPHRMMQVVKKDGAPEFGLMVGYPPSSLRGHGENSPRRNVASLAAFISPSKKQYPVAIEGGGRHVGEAMNPGDTIKTVAFRSLWSSKVFPDATSYAQYQDGDSEILVVDFDKSLNRARLPLPDSFKGKSLTVINKSDTVRVGRTGLVYKDHVQVSVVGGGFVTFRAI
ncbi:hypothetical protein [Metapseudomonas furukawaii]